MAVDFFTGHQSGQHFFHVKGGNGEVVAQSEAYTRAADAVRGYNDLVNIMVPDVMKHLLVIMFTGWKLHEASYNTETRLYTRDATDCMKEAAGGNPILGSMLLLFDHWSDDIQSLAAHYGVTIDRVGDRTFNVRTDVPPAPSWDHYFSEGEWKAWPTETETSSAELPPA